MGANQSVYVANASGQDIYVIATHNVDWALVDIVFDFTLLAVGVSAWKAPSTLLELYNILTISAEVAATGGAVYDSLIDAFKENSIKIPDKTHKNVKDKSFLSMYSCPSGFAGVAGAKMVSILVMSGDRKQVARWASDPDESWIATSKETIVRSKYRTIWEENPSAGKHDWWSMELRMQILFQGLLPRSRRHIQWIHQVSHHPQWMGMELRVQIPFQGLLPRSRRYIQWIRQASHPRWMRTE